MTELLFEYLNYIVTVFSASVSIAVAVLFWIAYRRHRTLHTLLRAIGFLFLAEAFGFHLFERTISGLAYIAFGLEIVGFLIIYYALLVNRDIGQVFYSEVVFENRPKPLKKLPEFIRYIGFVILISFGFYLIVNQLTGSITHVLATLVFATTIVCFSVIVEKFKRLISGTKERFRSNLIVLVGFILIQIRQMISVAYYAPAEMKLPNHTEATDPNGLLWLILSFLTLIAFTLIFFWQWEFVKKRFFIRLIEVLLQVSILLSVLSSLIILILGYSAVRSSNYNLLSNNNKLVEKLIMDKLKVASTTAKALSFTPSLVNFIENPNETSYKELSHIIDATAEYVDYVRLISVDGEVLMSPLNRGEEGKVLTDQTLFESINSRASVLYFGRLPGDTGGVVTARGINPLIVDNKVIALLTMNFKIDDEFMMHLKDDTNLDLMLFLNGNPIVSTIDNSIESFKETSEITQNLENQRNFETIVSIGDTEYYVSFLDLQPTTSEYSVSLASLRNLTQVTDAFKRDLIIGFVIITNLAFIVTFMSYLTLRKGYRLDVPTSTTI